MLAGEVVDFFEGEGRVEELQAGEDFAGVYGAGVKVDFEGGGHCCCRFLWFDLVVGVGGERGCGAVCYASRCMISIGCVDDGVSRLIRPQMDIVSRSVNQSTIESFTDQHYESNRNPTEQTPPLINTPITPSTTKTSSAAPREQPKSSPYLHPRASGSLQKSGK